MRRAAAAGAWLCALAVAAGAFGAHALRGRVDAAGLELWQTAARYLALGGFGLLAGGLGGGGPLARVAVWCLGLGSALFALTLDGLALGAPRWLGAVTPLGGLAMIVGFVLLGAGFLRRARPDGGARAGSPDG